MRSPARSSAARAIIIISNVVQPTSCITFSAAGRYEPFIPKAARMLTSEVTPWSLPIFPARARSSEPPIDPAIIAMVASMKLASERNEPAESTSRPTPRLDHRIKMFMPPSFLALSGTGAMPHSVDRIIDTT